MANKEIDLNNEDFGFFLQWYKEVYGNEWDVDYDTAQDIIDICMSPHKYTKHYKEYQLIKYQEQNNKINEEK